MTQVRVLSTGKKTWVPLQIFPIPSAERCWAGLQILVLDLLEGDYFEYVPRGWLLKKINCCGVFVYAPILYINRKSYGSFCKPGYSAELRNEPQPNNKGRIHTPYVISAIEKGKHTQEV